MKKERSCLLYTSFLGVGTIIVTGQRHVSGLTTAASLWTSACIGLAVGIGFYSGAIFTTLGLILVFKYAKYIEVYVEEHSNTYDVYMEFENEDKMSMVIKKLREEDIMISNVVIIKKRSKAQSVVIQATMEAVSYTHLYVSTKVIAAAGVSSSASFEMLVCAIANYFFNEGKLEYGEYARAGQYAENVYWKKASGLMDQMACAAGGPILLDFSDKENISCEKIAFSFEDMGCRLVIVNTGKGHADLSEEYSSIPMRCV